METPQVPLTRRRMISSCSNCHRRKQKCNRRRPCNNCTIRKVGHECFYDAPPWSTGANASLESEVTPRKIEEPGNRSNNTTPATRDAFGYSAVAESNAFVEASKLIQNSSNYPIKGTRGASVSPTRQKYWSVISKLPAPAILDELISAYLSEVHWIYGIIEPHYFNIYLEEWRVFTSSTSGSTSIDVLSVELKSFPAMLFQLMATSLLYLPPWSRIVGSLESSPLELSQRYSDAGVELLDLLGYKGNSMNAVVHDLLRAAWLKNRGRGAEAWHALNGSIRRAQEFNLHRKSKPHFDPSKEEFWYREWKRRLWTTLSMWDSNMSVLLGRPRLINVFDCDIEMPIDCEIPSSLEHVQLSSIQAYASQDNRLPSTACMNIYMYLLSDKMNEMRNLGADKRDLKDYSVVQRLHYEILALLEDLPLVFRPSSLDTSWDLQMPVLPRQRDKIYTCAHSLLIALHRPHVAKHPESRRQAQEAALNVLDSQQRFFEVINAHHYSYFGNAFFTIDASIVLSTVVSVYTSRDIDMLHRTLTAIQQGLGRLSLLEEQNELAPFGLKIVRSCYQKVKDRYSESKRINSTVTPDWSTNSTTSEAVHANYQQFDFMELGNDTNTIFPDFDTGLSIQAELSQADQVGRNEWDTSFWMGYRNQVFNDAIIKPNGESEEALPSELSFNI